MIVTVASAIVALSFTAPADTLGYPEPLLTFQATCAAVDSAERPLPIDVSAAASGQRVGVHATVPADWIGRRIWIRAVDAAGNVGDRSNLCVVIAGPTVYALGVPGDTTELVPFRVDPDSLLDDFAGDGELRPEWLTSGAPRREAGHLTLSEPIRWQARPFPAMQQAWITLRTPNPDKAGILLKIQPDGSRLEAAWEPGQFVVRTREGGAWTVRGTAPVSAFAGDVLAARLDSLGELRAWKNGALIGRWDCSGWAHASGGGMVGLSATGIVWLDEFGAGGWSHPAIDPLATRDTVVFSTLGRDRSGVEVRWTTATVGDESVRWAGFSYRDAIVPAASCWPADIPVAFHFEELLRREFDGGWTERICRRGECPP